MPRISPEGMVHPFFSDTVCSVFQWHRACAVQNGVYSGPEKSYESAAKSVRHRRSIASPCSVVFQKVNKYAQSSILNRWKGRNSWEYFVRLVQERDGNLKPVSLFALKGLVDFILKQENQLWCFSIFVKNKFGTKNRSCLLFLGDPTDIAVYHSSFARMVL